MPSYVGSKWTRIAAVVLATACVAAVLAATRTEDGSSLRSLLFTAAFVTGVATAACLPLCSRRFFPIWMRWAEKLNTVVMTALFGLCYLLIVPLFFLVQWRKDPLRLRGNPSATTFWISRSKSDPQSFERMG